MIERVAGAGRPAVASAEEARLRAATAQLEGVFMTHLMRALRETKPEGGIIDGGAGEAMFTSMMDEHLAQVAAERQQSGLGATLYRQLRAALSGAAEAIGATAQPAVPSQGHAVERPQ